LPGEELLVVIVATGGVGLELEENRRFPLVDWGTGVGNFEEQQWTGAVQKGDVHIALLSKRINQFANEIEFDFRVVPIAVHHPHGDVNVGAWPGTSGGLGTEDDDEVQAIAMGYVFQFLVVYLNHQGLSAGGGLGRAPHALRVL